MKYVIPAVSLISAVVGLLVNIPRLISLIANPERFGGIRTSLTETFFISTGIVSLYVSILFVLYGAIRLLRGLTINLAESGSTKPSRPYSRRHRLSRRASTGNDIVEGVLGCLLGSMLLAYALMATFQSTGLTEVVTRYLEWRSTRTGL